MFLDFYFTENVHLFSQKKYLNAYKINQADENTQFFYGIQTTYFFYDSKNLMNVFNYKKKKKYLFTSKNTYLL